MMTAQDIHELSLVTDLLAGGLARGAQTVSDVPLEVAQALAEARDQMRELPEVIENLNLSMERFHTVAAAVSRLIELADQASGADLDEAARRELNDEFAAVSLILAADAGRQGYAGPRLNLLNQGEARSAAKIVRYLEPVIANTAQELAGQQGMIREAVAETLNFLGIVAQCYPESAGVETLGRLLAEARKLRSFESKISTPAGRLH